MIRVSVITPPLLAVSLIAFGAELTEKQIMELTVFGGKAMGANVSTSDVNNILSEQELNKLVAVGINLNSLLCASVTEIKPLKIDGRYEVTCVAFRSGTAKKAYVVDALKGVAFEI